MSIMFKTTIQEAPGFILYGLFGAEARNLPYVGEDLTNICKCVVQLDIQESMRDEFFHFASPLFSAKILRMSLANLNNADPILKAMMNGKLAWGNVANLSDGAVRELGIEGAMKEAKRSSARRNSSGRTSSIQRREGRKGRQAHYTRKAILEREKEEGRRSVWLRRHPGASESNWRRREANRKTRKAVERQLRKNRKH
jgi:hypothetical protein